MGYYRSLKVQLDDVQRIPFLTPITTRAVHPTASLWPSCALCGCDVTRCECDVDEAMGAALTAMMNRNGGEA